MVLARILKGVTGFFFGLIILATDLVHGQEDSISLVKDISPVLVFGRTNAVPFTRTTISEERIQEVAEPIIGPLLNATAGLWMQSGTLGTNRISIRGVGYREPFAITGIKVYLDEIPLTNGAGEANFEDIHPAILSGIDIWRGPVSALWGAGLGGMIHLKPRAPTENDWLSSVQVGSFGRLQLDQHVSARYGQDNLWGTALHYQFLNDKGFRENNRYQRHSMTWMQQWTPTSWAINSFLHFVQLKAFIPSSVTLEDYRNQPLSAAPTWAAVKGNEDYHKLVAGINLRHTDKSGWVYRGSLSGTFFHSDEVRPFNVLNEGNIAFSTRQRISFSIARNIHFTTGMEYYHERYNNSTFETLTDGNKGDYLASYDESRMLLQGFAQMEWSPKQWHIIGGLHSAFNRFASGEIRDRIPFAIYPSLAISRELQQKWVLSASVSRGYSALSFSDIVNADGSVNLDITPESGWSGEIGLKFQPAGESFVHLNLYQMHIRNTIITRRYQDDLFEKINGGSTIQRGVELEFKWDLPKVVYLEGALTLSDHRFDQFVDQGRDRSGFALPGSPRARLYARLGYQPEKPWSFYLEHHSVSRVFLTDDNTATASGYFLLNAGFRYQWSLSPDRLLTVSGHVHNLADIHYASMFQINAPGAQPRYYYPGKPRAFYLTVSFAR